MVSFYLNSNITFETTTYKILSNLQFDMFYNPKLHALHCCNNVNVDKPIISYFLYHLTFTLLNFLFIHCVVGYLMMDFLLLYAHFYFFHPSNNTILSFVSSFSFHFRFVCVCWWFSDNSCAESLLMVSNVAPSTEQSIKNIRK